MRSFLQTLLLCALAAVTRFTPSASAGPSHEILHAFQLDPAKPSSELIQATDGNFYGTTEFGGASDAGTVFKITPSGAMTTLAHFTGNGLVNKGAKPLAALVQGSDGNFYGTTYSGGALNYGTVFKMTPAGVVTTLVEFTNNGATNKGKNPKGKLMQAGDGNFYGTTAGGGVNDKGTVFKMTTAGVLTTLVEFTGNAATNKGASPEAGLIEGGDGKFYGTTKIGGANDLGTVFRITPAGALTTMVQFTGNGASKKGANPVAALVKGTDGNFYGTTFSGGGFDSGLGGYGTAFRMTPAGVLTTLVEFSGSGGTTKGAYPKGALVQGSDGNFYGTTSGHVAGFPFGYAFDGTVFKMTPTGALTILVELHQFGTPPTGARPPAGLVQGVDGNFYGVTYNGGDDDGGDDNGTVFKVTSAGVLTTLLKFAGNDLGDSPKAGLVRGTDGNFYGTANDGGADDYGTVFKLTPSGVRTTLVEFAGTSGTNLGAFPEAGLVRGIDAYFYGTTYAGGVGYGTVFKVSPAGALTTLVNFYNTGTTNKGRFPLAGLVQDSAGNFYGTTASGGANNDGTIFRMTPAGALTTLVEFTWDGTTNRGARPSAELVKGSDGFLYGTTATGGTGSNGTIFKMTPAGELTTLVEFTGFSAPNKGSKPLAALLPVGSAFYGTTDGGGASGSGTIFKVTSTGVLTTLVDFTGNETANKGANPQGTLVRAADGYIYGTTRQGGANNAGTLFKMSTAGVLTTLVHFSPWPSSVGAYPRGALIKGPDNNLYGTTEDGGADNGGTAFRLRFGPTPVTQAATSVAATTATLRGTVNPRGNATDVTFQYGISPNLNGATTLIVGTLPAGTTNQAVSMPVGGLARKTRYYFKVVAKNAENTLPQSGNILSFTTLP